MWAEITLESKSDLPEDLGNELAKRFSPSSDKVQTIAETVWAGAPELQDQLLFAHQTNARVLLAHRPESRTLKVHVECTQQRRNMAVLKRHVEEICGQMERFLSHHNNRVAGPPQIVIADEDFSEMQVGTRLRRRDKLARSFRDQLPPKVYVPIATYAGSVILGYPQGQALTNVAAALVATLLWVGTESIFRRSYEYKEH